MTSSDNLPPAQDTSRPAIQSPLARSRPPLGRSALVTLAPLALLVAIAAWGYVANKDPLRRLEMVMARRAGGSLDSLDRELQRLSVRDPYGPYALLLRGWGEVDQINTEQGRSDAAFRNDSLLRAELAAMSCLKAAEADPPAPTRLRVEARLLAAFLLVQRDNSIAAMEQINLALLMEPHNLTAHRYAVAIYVQTGAYAYALDAANKLAPLAPYDPTPPRQAGKLNQSYLDNTVSALVAYEEAMSRNPWHENRADILFGRALAHLREGQPTEAIAFFDQLETESTSEKLRQSILQFRAEAFAVDGRPDEAEAIYEQLVRESPNDVDFARAAATFFVEHDKPQRAIEILEPIYERGLGKMDLATQLLRAYKQTKNKEKVEALAEALKPAAGLIHDMDQLSAAASGDEKDPDIRYRTGVVAAKMGRYSEARQWFKAALRLKRDHKEALQALQELPKE